MEIIEKTVFISYRRNNVPWAIAINKCLTPLGYDVFFDFRSILSGDFEQIITENIKARAHFIILLSPSALERCDKPNDWFRREMEIALKFKRNIVPVLLEGFDFGAQATIDYLTGELENIRNYNGLTLTAEYFDAGIEKLNKFLSISLDKVLHPVLHPVSPKIQKIVNKQKRAVAEQAPVDEKILSAQEWFERAYKSKPSEDQIRLYTKAIELDPKFSFAYNNRGISYAELEQYQRAIEDYNQAIKLNPDFATAYVNRGISYSELKQYEKAFEDYNQAFKLIPDYANAYFNRGTSYSKLKQYEKAIEDYNQAIKLNPEDAYAYNNRGLIYSKLKQYEKAFEDINQAIKLNPEFSSAYINRGLNYSELKQYEKAIEEYNQAIKLNPDYTDAYDNRGTNYSKLEQYEKAIEDYNQVIKLNPEDGPAFYNKACVYALQGKAEDASRCLRFALIKNPQEYCELSRNESDFDKIRGDANFQNLLKEFCDKC